jgi:hypothetical protein
VSIFHKQHLFTTTAQQKPDADLYLNLVIEECVNELVDIGYPKYATSPSTENLVEVMDAVCDSIVVLAGLANALVGPDKAAQCFEEVMNSNFSKFEVEDGKYVAKFRDDGKIQKGRHYFPPDLFSIITDIPK